MNEIDVSKRTMTNYYSKSIGYTEWKVKQSKNARSVLIKLTVNNNVIGFTIDEPDKF